MAVSSVMYTLQGTDYICVLINLILSISSAHTRNFLDRNTLVHYRIHVLLCRFPPDFGCANIM